VDNPKNTSIRKELFQSSIFLSCAVLIIFSIFLSTVFYYNEISNVRALIQQRNHAVTFFIDGYFTKIHNDVEILSSNWYVRHAMDLDQTSRQKILDLYQSFEDVDSDITHIYSGYQDGSLLINNYIPPVDYNPVIRPWYRAAVESQPDLSDGVPYQEIKSREWLISISRVLTDTDGNLTGVLAIDSFITAVADVLNHQYRRYKTSHSFVVKLDGEIIIHPDKSLLSGVIVDKPNIKIDFTQMEAAFDLNYNDVFKFAHYHRIDNIGWAIVTVVDKSEIIASIISKIVFIISVIAVVSMIIGWYLSSNLSKRIITPLLELKQRVTEITAGKNYNGSVYVYPNNEIGVIASDIEQLASNELHDKNVTLQNINRELELLSTTDQLTKLYNRRKMDHELEKELLRAQRYGHDFLLIMFDIDRFKNINDEYGHQMGDRVLEEIATLTRKTLRSTDIVSRWGGDEFLILCPGTTLVGAVTLVDNFHAGIANHQFFGGAEITISIGVCEFSGQKNVEELLSQVDKKLYEAKRQGRNMVVI